MVSGDWTLSRNRWATQGFDFLQAIEPAFISALPEDDFLVWNILIFFFHYKTNTLVTVYSWLCIFKYLTVVLKYFLHDCNGSGEKFKALFVA